MSFSKDLPDEAGKGTDGWQIVPGLETGNCELERNR